MAYLKVIWCCILIGWMVGRIISCHGILVTSIGLCVIHFGKNLAPNWKRWLCNAVSTILLLVGARPLTLIWNKKKTIWIKTRAVLYFIWPLDIKNMSDSFQKIESHFLFKLEPPVLFQSLFSPSEQFSKQDTISFLTTRVFLNLV